VRHSFFIYLICVLLQADYPVLSDDWIKMAEQIGRIGEITEMVSVVKRSTDDLHAAQVAYVALMSIGAKTPEGQGCDAVGVRRSGPPVSGEFGRL
jgi:hypothetical protein